MTNVGQEKSSNKEGQRDGNSFIIPKENLFSHKFLFGVIFSRCRDAAATVRAKVFKKEPDFNEFLQRINTL